MRYLDKLQAELIQYYSIDSRVSDISVRLHHADQKYDNHIVVFYRFNGEGRIVFVDMHQHKDTLPIGYIVQTINSHIVNCDGRLLAYQHKHVYQDKEAT